MDNITFVCDQCNTCNVKNGVSKVWYYRYYNLKVKPDEVERLLAVINQNPKNQQRLEENTDPLIFFKMENTSEVSYTDTTLTGTTEQALALGWQESELGGFLCPRCVKTLEEQNGNS